MDARRYDKLTEEHSKRLDELAKDLDRYEDPPVVICMSLQSAEAFKPWLTRLDHNSTSPCCQCGMTVIYDRRRCENSAKICVRCAEAMSKLGQKEFSGMTSDISEIDDQKIYRGIEKSMSQKSSGEIQTGNRQESPRGASLGMYS